MSHIRRDGNDCYRGLHNLEELDTTEGSLLFCDTHSAACCAIVQLGGFGPPAAISFGERNAVVIAVAASTVFKPTVSLR